MDPPQRVLRIVELTLLEMYSREPERSFVFYSFIDVPFEHGFDSAPCAVMHAVIEFEIADRKFGAIDVVVQSVEFGLVQTAIHDEFRVEPLECIEILPLIGVIKRFAEKEISQFWGRSLSFGATFSRLWPITRKSAARGRTNGKYQGQAESD